jgi:hypothetical protein
MFINKTNVLNTSDIKQNTKQMNSEDRLIDALNNNCISPSTIQNQVKNKLQSFKQNIFSSSPKVNKRKINTQLQQAQYHQKFQETSLNTPPNSRCSPSTDPKSWFQRLNLKNSEKNLVNQGYEKEKEIFSKAMTESPNLIRVYLVKSFFSLKELSHNISTMSNNLFNCEYRCGKLLGRNMKFKVEIIPYIIDNHRIRFTLLSGSSSIYKGICQSILLLIYQQQQQAINDQINLQQKYYEALNNLQPAPVSPHSRSTIYYPVSPQVNRRQIKPQVPCTSPSKLPSGPYNIHISSETIDSKPIHFSSDSSTSSSTVPIETGAVYFFREDFMNHYNCENIAINKNTYGPKTNGANYSFS